MISLFKKQPAPIKHEIVVPAEYHQEAAELADQVLSDEEHQALYRIQLLARSLGGNLELKWKLHHYVNRYGFVLVAKEVVG